MPFANDITSSLTTISADQLDSLFEGGDVKVDASVPSNVKVENETPPIQATSSTEIPVIDLDELEAESEPTEEKKDPEAKKDEKPEAPKEEEKKEDEDLSEVNSVLKKTASYLIQKGIFKDFDGSEELEITPEVYAELVEKQVEQLVEERFQDRKAASGEYGQAIIDYIEQGGNADDVIDLFKEQQAVQQFEIADSDSQRDIITKWYKDQHNWSETKIKKFLDTLASESDEALEQEAQEIKDKYDSHFKEQLEAVKTQQAAVAEQQRKAKQQFEQNITKAIDSQKFDEKRKRFLKDSVFKSKRTDDGRQISDLYIKFAELQANPESYAEFVEWVMDKEGYLKRQLTPAKNEIAQNAFNTIKGNSALSTNKGSRHETNEKENSKGVDFSSLFKR